MQFEGEEWEKNCQFMKNMQIDKVENWQLSKGKIEKWKEIKWVMIDVA